MERINAPELAAWLADGSRPNPVLIDVREPPEFEICRIDGSILMPMNSIPQRLPELDRNTAIVCICHHGGRSMNVAAYLERNGFTSITNLTGGVHAWALQVDPAMPTY